MSYESPHSVPEDLNLLGSENDNKLVGISSEHIESPNRRSRYNI